MITDFNGSLFENGATNNTGIAPQPITVTVMPRPNLEVANIQAPSSVNAGGTFSVTYTVVNDGTAATTVNWDDKIYLSLTPYVDRRLDPDPGPSQSVGARTREMSIRRRRSR